MGHALTSRSRHARGLIRGRMGPKDLTEEHLEALQGIRALAPQAKDTIERLLTCGSYRVELAAAQEVCDRTYGRAEKRGTMQVNHTGSQQPPQAPEDQEAMLVAALAAVRARKAQEALVVDAEPHQSPEAPPGGIQAHEDSETADDL